MKKHQVEFDFLGKDSIRYKQTIEFDENLVANLVEFSKGKKDADTIFDAVSSKDVSDFLDGVLTGLSAKQFRTAIGTALLAQELKNTPVDPEWKERKKVEAFTEANLAVAIKLNHQSAVSANWDVSLDKMKTELKMLKEVQKTEKDGLQKNLADLKLERKNAIDVQKKRKSGSELKEGLARVNAKYDSAEEKLNNKLAKMKERVEALDAKIKMKEKTRGVALGTSKSNYANPRVAYSWCKDNGVNLDRIIPKTLQRRFTWAEDTPADFYKNYPNV
jgi:DNA topoisomerase-1